MTAPRAIVVFLKEPRAGAVKTRLGRTVGMERAAEIYRACADRVLDHARSAGRSGTRALAAYAPGSDPGLIRAWAAGLEIEEQQGATLGERMRRAIGRRMAEGAAQVLLVGSDVPELEAEMLLEAWRQLRSCDVVLGPAVDGGYYLVGMNAPVREIFGGIAWSSSSVLRQTLGRCRELGLRTALLPALADIDTEDDLLAYQQRLRARARGDQTPRAGADDDGTIL